jgi:riboflavin synthase
MFTGITTDVGEVRAVEPRAEGLRRLTIACSYPRAGIVIGASIAHSGVCMTVVETGEQGGRTWYAVVEAAESNRLTTPVDWKHSPIRILEIAV